MRRMDSVREVEGFWSGESGPTFGGWTTTAAEAVRRAESAARAKEQRILVVVVEAGSKVSSTGARRRELGSGLVVGGRGGGWDGWGGMGQSGARAGGCNIYSGLRADYGRLGNGARQVPFGTWIASKETNGGRCRWRGTFDELCVKTVVRTQRGATFVVAERRRTSVACHVRELRGVRTWRVPRACASRLNGHRDKCCAQ